MHGLQGPAARSVSDPSLASTLYPCDGKRHAAAKLERRLGTMKVVVSESLTKKGKDSLTVRNGLAGWAGLEGPGRQEGPGSEKFSNDSVRQQESRLRPRREVLRCSLLPASASDSDTTSRLGFSLENFSNPTSSCRPGLRKEDKRLQLDHWQALRQDTLSHHSVYASHRVQQQRTGSIVHSTGPAREIPSRFWRVGTHSSLYVRRSWSNTHQTKPNEALRV
jgi:hypothetical protein